MWNKILIIDDEELFREDLATLLENKGYKCRTAENPDRALQIIPSFLPDIILSDIVMPGRSGLEILSDIHRIHPNVSVIMMTAYGTLETAIEAFRNGAVDYILKPVVIDDLVNKIEKIRENHKLMQEIKYLRREVNKDVDSFSFVFHSPAMKKILEEIKKVAPKNSNILITGESGTGKEVVAKAIHEFSGKKDSPFIAINCAGFQENLLESELFGHVKGAFTSAINDKAGFFEIAGEGTIFLDEISELPITLQSKLLRVLEEREFYKVGDTKLLPLKARIITATNKDLKKLIKEGSFREDLYYRIAVFEINLPPLRKRLEDIPVLAEYFIKKFNDELKTNYKGVSPDVLQRFMSYSWPGNLRELRNIIERAMIICDGNLLTLEGLPEQLNEDSEANLSASNLKTAVHIFEKNFIIRALRQCKWNKEETARKLEINPSTLYRKMAEFNISDE